MKAAILWQTLQFLPWSRSYLGAKDWDVVEVPVICINWLQSYLLEQKWVSCSFMPMEEVMWNSQSQQLWPGYSLLAPLGWPPGFLWYNSDCLHMPKYLLLGANRAAEHSRNSFQGPALGNGTRSFPVWSPTSTLPFEIYHCPFPQQNKTSICSLM